jgi:predicted nucleic acid-binding protein
VAGVIVLDANVVIAFLDANDPHHAASLDLLERNFVDGFGCSVLTLAEALVHPTRADRQDAALASLTRIGVEMIPLEASDAIALADVRSTYKLRMPDAVALFTAMQFGAQLATFDADLASAAERAGVARAE